MRDRSRELFAIVVAKEIWLSKGIFSSLPIPQLIFSGKKSQQKSIVCPFFLQWVHQLLSEKKTLSLLPLMTLFCHGLHHLLLNKKETAIIIDPLLSWTPAVTRTYCYHCWSAVASYHLRPPPVFTMKHCLPSADPTATFHCWLKYMLPSPLYQSFLLLISTSLIYV